MTSPKLDKEDPEALRKNIKMLQNLLSQRSEQLNMIHNENKRLRLEINQIQQNMKSIQSKLMDSSHETQSRERRMAELSSANENLKTKMKTVKTSLQEIINDALLPSHMRHKLVMLLPLLISRNDVSSLITPSLTTSTALIENNHNDNGDGGLWKLQLSPTSSGKDQIVLNDGMDNMLLVDEDLTMEEYEEHNAKINHVADEDGPQSKSPRSIRASIPFDKQRERVDTIKKKRSTAPKLLNPKSYNATSDDDNESTVEDVLRSKVLPPAPLSTPSRSSFKITTSDAGDHLSPQASNALDSTPTPLILKSYSNPVTPVLSSPRNKPPPEGKPLPPIRNGHHKTLTTAPTTPSAVVGGHVRNFTSAPKSLNNSKMKEDTYTHPKPAASMEIPSATMDFVLEYRHDENEHRESHSDYRTEYRESQTEYRGSQVEYRESTEHRESQETDSMPAWTNLSFDEVTGELIIPGRKARAKAITSNKTLPPVKPLPIDSAPDRIKKRSESSGSVMSSTEKPHKSHELNQNHSNSISKARSASVEDMLQNKPEESSENKATKVWTLADLVMDVTFPGSNDMQKALSALILCHKAFTDSISLMRQLRCQFREGDQLHQLQVQMDQVNENEKISKDWLVRVRVCNVVRFWMKHYWEEDFVSQKELQQELSNLKQDIEQLCEPQKAQTLTEKLEATVQGLSQGKLTVNGNDTINNINPDILLSPDTSPIKKESMDSTQRKEDSEKEENFRQDQVHIRWPHLEKSNIIVPNGMDLMLLDPDEIAQQLTLMDFHLFKQIKARECIGQSWKKKGKEKWRLAGNVLRMIAQFNSISKWTELTVLGGKTPKERANLLKKIISMIKSLQKYRNFSSFCACHAALNSDDVRRLKQSWEKLPRASRKEWDELNEYFDWRMTKLKQLQEQSIGPAVPHIGLYLQVLFNIDEGKEDTSTEGGVNYVKMMMLNDQIERLMQYQQGKYKISEKLQIQKLLYQEFATQYKMSEKRVSQLADIVRNTEREK